MNKKKSEKVKNRTSASFEPDGPSDDWLIRRTKQMYVHEGSASGLAVCLQAANYVIVDNANEKKIRKTPEFAYSANIALSKLAIGFLCILKCWVRRFFQGFSSVPWAIVSMFMRFSFNYGLEEKHSRNNIGPIIDECRFFLLFTSGSIKPSH